METVKWKNDTMLALLDAKDMQNEGFVPEALDYLRNKVEVELQAKSNNVTIVHTELHVAIPEGHMGIIVPRSGVALKHGVQVVNTPGIIDSGYRGEIMIGLVNHGNELYHINKGDRVAQLIIVPFRTPSFIDVDTLGETERGVGGFGSTGIK